MNHGEDEGDLPTQGTENLNTLQVQELSGLFFIKPQNKHLETSVYGGPGQLWTGSSGADGLNKTLSWAPGHQGPDPDHRTRAEPACPGEAFMDAGPELPGLPEGACPVPVMASL